MARGLKKLLSKRVEQTLGDDMVVLARESLDSFGIQGCTTMSEVVSDRLQDRNP
jgi:hypothetical protein